MSVKATEEQYKKFGRCIFLDNGIVRLGVTLDVGPRIVYFSLCGKENIMFEDDGKTFSEKAGDIGVWYAYGGHRLWMSPELNPETYYPDNSKVEYTFENGVLTLTPPPTSFGKAFSVEVEMSESSPRVKLTHRIKNISDKASTFAAWSITSMTQGGVCFVPLSKKPTGYLANRMMALWDYADINDPRFKLTNTSARLKQDKNAEKAFKTGFNSEDGFAAYAVNGQVFIKCFNCYDERTYPDFGCNFEMYTNKLFLECETLGEIREFAPGETAEISEQWCIYEKDTDFDGDPEEIREELSARKNEILDI